MPKVSVIVPIYGVERYIERCSRSLFEQTLDDMEFIFVNDCTTDNSMEELGRTIEKYPERRNQIVILNHDHNKGLSHARETGIKAATGMYIAHCDSDDWVERTMYEEMFNFAVSGNYEYVKCGHRKTDLKGIDDVILVNKGRGGLCTETVMELLLEWKGWNSIWDTLVQRNVYKRSDLSFTDFAMLEDLYVVSQLIPRAKRIGILNKPLYNYFVNPNSICNTSGSEAFINRAKQAKSNMDWVLSNLAKEMEVTYRLELTAKWFVKNILIPIMDKKENRAYWNSVYPELNALTIWITRVSVINKVRFISAESGLYKYFKR